MGKQLYYEDIEPGAEMAPLTKQPTTRQLVMWAGAVGDYQPIHYDKDFALSHNLPGVIVHGQLVGAFLGQLMTDWVGEQGSLRKLGCSYKGMNFPGEAITCRGKVTKKYIQNGQYYVECRLWAENPKGEKTATGNATAILPVKN
jgi:acyl dehydratase